MDASKTKPTDASASARDEEGQGSGARSVVRALRVLELFTVDRVSLGVAAVAEALDVPRPTAHRLLVTLLRRGYVRQEVAGGPYALGARVLALAQAYEASEPLTRAALPSMHDLLAKTGESVALHIRQDAETRICLHRVESAHPMQIVIPIGQPMALRYGAAGRVLRLDAEAARRGEAIVSRGERVPNACSIAAPVVDHRGALVAALDISGPLDRFPPAATARHRKAVVAAALRISTTLGYRP
ncbi:MAG: IclR family transcriptional regulator [Vulcanimicrobiaceae bacterium]